MLSFNRTHFLEVTYCFEVFFGQVWENSGKYPRTPKNLPAPTPMTKCVPVVVIQHCIILKNARACISTPFQRFLNAQVCVGVFIFEK